MSRASTRCTMDSLFKALLTAGTVLLVMVAARQGGRRFAGGVAALPKITAHTLAWLADDEGMPFAVSAAVGSGAARGMLAVFALVYARAARHSGGTVALVCGLSGALAFALPAEAATADLTCAMTLAVASSAVAFVAMPRSHVDVASRKGSLRLVLLVAERAGATRDRDAAVNPPAQGISGNAPPTSSGPPRPRCNTRATRGPSTSRSA